MSGPDRTVEGGPGADGTGAARPAARTAGPRGTGARLAVAAAFSTVFLWQAYGAVSDLNAWAGIAAVMRQQLSAFAWAVLLLGLVIPVVVFVAAVLLGWRRSPGRLALILLVALCASQALGVSQYAFFLAGVGTL